MIVSNAGPLIHLAKIGRINLLEDVFGEIIVPRTVKVEVIDKGKEKGRPDAFLIDNVDWIKIVGDSPNADRLAEKAGLHRGEACAILLAKSFNVPVLFVRRKDPATCDFMHISTANNPRR